MTLEENARLAEEYLKYARPRFPLELKEVSGEHALAEWERLRSVGRGYPVVLGADDDWGSFGNLMTPFGPDAGELRPVKDILTRASTLRFPDDLEAFKKAQFEAARARWPDLEESPPAVIGEWPDTAPEASALNVAMNSLTKKPHELVYIGLADTDDWTTIPALLRWGSWNDCPPPEYMWPHCVIGATGSGPNSSA